MPDNTTIKLGEYSFLQIWLGLYFQKKDGHSWYTIRGVEKGLEIVKEFDLFSDAEEFFNQFISNRMVKGVFNV